MCGNRVGISSDLLVEFIITSMINAASFSVNCGSFRFNSICPVWNPKKHDPFMLNSLGDDEAKIARYSGIDAAMPDDEIWLNSWPVFGPKGYLVILARVTRDQKADVPEVGGSVLLIEFGVFSQCTTIRVGRRLSHYGSLRSTYGSRC